jgi:hypothetical protein
VLSWVEWNLLAFWCSDHPDGGCRRPSADSGVPKAVIGPSAVVIDDVAPGEVVAGVPVRTIPNTRDIYTRTANKTLASKI